MKKLHLLRHAKSSWDYPHLNDRERPLKRRGYKDAAIMATALHAAGIELPEIFCSSARRAQLTIQTISEHWPGQELEWQVTDGLYTFSEHALMSWLIRRFAHTDALMVVGHNPGLTDLINEVSTAGIANFPTCAYAEIEFKNKLTEGELVHYLKPKMFK